MPAIYRIRQFVRAAGAWLHADDAEQVHRILPPAAANLFRGMPGYDRRHALSVLRHLQEGGQTDSDLLAAALLHDVGTTADQTRRMRLWHRVAVVLLRAVSPVAIERIGRDEPGSWRQPFYVQQHHGAIGAELAREVGCSPRTADLIRLHEEPAGETGDSLLAALQAADSAN
jgi:putative nucleotidyltransferase with HDIG domain